MGAAINLATDYSETDPNSRITRTTVTCAGAGLRRDEAAFVNKDWGAGYFGDFVHDFDSSSPTIANGSKLILWGLSNTNGSKDAWAAGLYLQLDASSTLSETITLGEIGGSTSVGGSHQRAAWYWRIERNGTTLTAKRANSAANRLAGTWVETLTLTVATTTFQYQYAMSTISEANTTAITISTSNFKGTKMTTAGTPFDTVYTPGGAVTGNWDAGATWGNAGSVKGTDYPGTAADVFTIDAGDVVTYNVSETNALGASNVYGTLTFKKDSNTKMVFGAVALTIKSGGTLAIGTVANPIDPANTAELYFTTTADSQLGLDIAAGAACTVEGSQMHGGTYRTYLIAAWSSGQTFTVKGDVTTDWVAGQTVLVHRFPATPQNGLFAEFTIASMAANGSDTDITISEAAPGVAYRSGGFVYHTTRNVKLGKVSATRTVQNINTQRPRLAVFANGTTWRECEIVGAATWGIDGTHGNLLTAVGVICRNGGSHFGSESYYGKYVATDVLCTSIGVGIYRCAYDSLMTRVHLACGGSTTVAPVGVLSDATFVDCVISGYVYALGNVITHNCKFIGCEWVDTTSVFDPFSRGSYFYNCLFGKHAHEATNISAIVNDAYTISNEGWNAKFFNCWFSTEDGTGLWPKFNLNNPIAFSATNDVASSDHNQVSDAMQRCRGLWRYKKNTTTTRGGGAAASMEFYGLDYCHAGGINAPAFEWTEFDVGTSEITRSVYILGGGWSAWPTAAEVFFEAEYYDEAGTNHRELIKSTQVMTDNATWTKLSVTFTPGKSGYANYRFFVGVLAGTASTKIYLDPVLNDA